MSMTTISATTLAQTFSRARTTNKYKLDEHEKVFPVESILFVVIYIRINLMKKITLNRIQCLTFERSLLRFNRAEGKSVFRVSFRSYVSKEKTSRDAKKKRIHKEEIESYGLGDALFEFKQTNVFTCLMMTM